MSMVHGILSMAWRHKLKLSALLVALIGLTIVFGGQSAPQAQVSDNKPVVEVASASTLSGEQSVSLVGTVRSFSEAEITAEASGRVTSVNAVLGQTVPAGFVLVTLENAAEQAAVLQAEGVYESALAASAQSTVGVAEANTTLTNAKNSAITTVSNAYNTTNGIVRNNIDLFFANPDARVPGLKIDGRGNTAWLNSERVAFQTLLTDWQREVSSLTVSADLDASIQASIQHVDRTIALVDVFLSLFTDPNADNSYSDAELIAFNTTFTGLRSTLEATKSSLNGSVATLANAEDVVRRASISASGSQTSASDAQVKQALGALRAAQANLSKTILRTPISGTVNSLPVRVGDFVGNQAVVARVANNNALEVVTYVGDQELNAFVEGATVIIEDSHQGIVTEVAPAVDPVTRKTEVRIALETAEVQNGDTVSISKSFELSDSNQPISIPLSAVKFEIEDGKVFVVENGVLVAKSVELGAVRGGSVVITSGLSTTDEFVIDARGLTEGTEVEIRQ